MFITAVVVFLLVMSSFFPLTARIHNFIGKFLECVWNSIRISYAFISPESTVGVRLSSMTYLVFVFTMLKLFFDMFGFTGLAVVVVYTFMGRGVAPTTNYHLPDTVRKRPVMRKPTLPNPEGCECPPNTPETEVAPHPCELSGVRIYSVPPNTPSHVPPDSPTYRGGVSEGTALGTLA